MNITIGIVCLIIAMIMRHWGRERGMVHPLLRPLYQNRQNFWFLFSLIGIILFVAGIVFVTIAFLE